MYANRLLVLMLFAFVNILLVTFLFEWNPGFYAYIYRFPSPLLYCIFPAAYLYIRALIYSESSFRKKDFLHFLLSVLYLTEMLPHYFSSYEYRLSMIRNLKDHPVELISLNDGFLPAYYHLSLLCVQTVCYLIATFSLLQKSGGWKGGCILPYKTKNRSSMKILVSVSGVIIFSMLITLITHQAISHNDIQALIITYTVCILSVNVYLFFQPALLYGISQQKTTFLPRANSYVQQPHERQKQGGFNNEQFHQHEVVQDPLPVSNLEIYKPVLELYMQSNAPFLKQGYSIYNLSRETGIPQHHLSALLNRVYKMRFTDYINEMRICYIKTHFNNNEWEKLTLEGIAKHAGFRSRTTFFNAIKKTCGITPSAFLAELKKQSNSVYSGNDNLSPVYRMNEMPLSYEKNKEV